MRTPVMSVVGRGLAGSTAESHARSCAVRVPVARESRGALRGGGGGGGGRGAACMVSDAVVRS